MRPRHAALLPFVASIPWSLAAQVATAPVGAPYQFTIEDYARAERFLAPTSNPLVSGVAARAVWLGDGRFWYRATTPNGSAFVVVNPAKRTRAPLFDHAKLAAALSAASGTPVEGERLPFRDVELSADGGAVTVALRARSFSCDLKAYTCAAAAAKSTLPANASVSPDGKTAVFIRASNLWARDLASGKDTPLTTDGIKEFGYATNNAGWVHSDDPVVTWSPDSKAVATFQHDGRGVRDMVLVSTNVGNPRVEQWKYPMPGDSAVFRLTRVIITIGPDGAGKVVRFEMPPDAHRSTVSDHVACGGAICDTQWYPDGSKLAFVSSSRDHKQAWLRVADAQTGAVRTLLEEKSATQVGDAAFPEHLWRMIPASNEFIWWSDRENFTQLYLHDLASGALKNRITMGDGNVTEIVRIDEKKRVIYFMANGKEPGEDPYFHALYRVGFDGKGQVRLTSETANHAVQLTPDGATFVDSWSTPTTPPVSVLRDAAAGRVLLALETADITRLVASGWRTPTPIRVKARDGSTDIHGLMYTPSTVDSARKYPIINHIYPGPQAGSVGPRNFAPSRGDNQALAELGFVVVEIDGMGTPGRSKAFRDAYYGQMDDNTIPDQVAGMKELARRYPFIDSTKAGIWGHSGGGFATASAMFRAPDFFKVGIAESGNHDNRNYEDDWGERYQGLLVKTGSTDNYAAEANQTYAKNLKGKLFLIHGGMDDNVPPVNTTLVADALVKAGKDFDLLILPNARHGYGADGAYVMRRRWDYFVRNLQGNIPPKEYQIGRPRVQP